MWRIRRIKENRKNKKNGENLDIRGMGRIWRMVRITDGC